MSFSFGKNFRISIFGQSHSKEIGVVIDGLKAGYRINYSLIKENLMRRRPGKNSISSPRKEDDEFEIVSGEVGGISCEAPLCIRIKNKDQRSFDYDNIIDRPRPSHADYPAFIKYNSHNDIRGGGSFSGRMTAPIVIAGSIAQDILREKNIRIFSRIKSIKDIEDKKLEYKDSELESLEYLKKKDFPVIDDYAGEEMIKLIEEYREKKDSLGGLVETFVIGMPVGVGEPFFDSLESVIAKGVFSIPSVKGLEFGEGFNSAKMTGSTHNDPYLVQNGKVITKTNHHGGIIGGLSTSMPIYYTVAIKPTSSIGIIQDTISLKNLSNEKLLIEGRHDPCIVPRALVAIEMISAICILDLLMEFEKWENLMS